MTDDENNATETNERTNRGGDQVRTQTIFEHGRIFCYRRPTTDDRRPTTDEQTPGNNNDVGGERVQAMGKTNGMVALCCCPSMRKAAAFSTEKLEVMEATNSNRKLGKTNLKKTTNQRNLRDERCPCQCSCQGKELQREAAD